MPSKVDKITVGSPYKDKRVKLLPCQKEMITFWYNRGMGIRALSRIFKTSRRNVQFILFPERLQKNKQARHERGGSKQYYKKEKQRDYMKTHRSNKKALLNFKESMQKK